MDLHEDFESVDGYLPKLIRAEKEDAPEPNRWDWPLRLTFNPLQAGWRLIDKDLGKPPQNKEEEKESFVRFQDLVQKVSKSGEAAMLTFELAPQSAVCRMGLRVRHEHHWERMVVPTRRH